MLEGGMLKVRPTTLQYCRQCSKSGYNVWTYQKVEETLDEDSDIKSNWFFHVVVEQLL